MWVYFYCVSCACVYAGGKCRCFLNTKKPHNRQRQWQPFECWCNHCSEERRDYSEVGVCVCLPWNGWAVLQCHIGVYSRNVILSFFLLGFFSVAFLHRFFDASFRSGFFHLLFAVSFFYTVFLQCYFRKITADNSVHVIDGAAARFPSLEPKRPCQMHVLGRVSQVET